MKTATFATILAMLMLCAASCATRNETTQTAPSIEDERLQLLLSWLEGSFDNTESLADTARMNIEPHYPIEIHHVRIPQFTNALYLEQASMQSPARPYRQRVYMVRREGADYRSEVYTIRNEAEYINAWMDPDRLRALRIGDLERRAGCDVLLAWDGEKFTGGTEGTGCESTLNGAAWATSWVTVSDGWFGGLDQGFSASGEQVWGAEKLPYHFRKRGSATTP